MANVGSWGVMEKLGMTREAVMRSYRQHAVSGVTWCCTPCSETSSSAANVSLPVRKAPRGCPPGLRTGLACRPAPDTGRLRKRTPTAPRASTTAARFGMPITRRFHPPGPGSVPSAIGRRADVPGPLSQRSRSPRRNTANGAPRRSAISNPRRA
jgi:hypothetical protein